MRSYEVVLIIHPDLDEKAFSEVVDRVKSWITDADGNIIKVDIWGKKKLAYEIRKQTEGQYVILYADMNPTFCTELERNLQLNESIMRFMITNAIETVEVETKAEVKETVEVEAETVAVEEKAVAVEEKAVAVEEEAVAVEEEAVAVEDETEEASE